MDIIGAHASTFGMDTASITADWIFDSGYVTWVGITPNDTETRNMEREQIQQLAKSDILAYIKAKNTTMRYSYLSEMMEQY